MNVAPTIVWFRRDLRLADNSALHAAIRRGGSVIPLFVHAPEEEAPWQPGGASRWWLHQSLVALDTELGNAGSRLVVRCGTTIEELLRVARETGAGAVYWNRCYEPAVLGRDRAAGEALVREGVLVEDFAGALLHEPGAIFNQSKKPYQVFTPFWKQCLGKPDPAEPVPSAERIPAPSKWPKSLAVGQLGLEPKPDWAGGLRAVWRPGEAGASVNLNRFLNEAFDDYRDQRDRPDVPGTSRLSPHLHFGEISPRQVWHGVRHMASRRGLGVERWRGSQFLVELGWREFAHHLLFHFPHTPMEPLRSDFREFPWREEPAWDRAWRQGRTGYPIVDAGMRELWATGWMHNRVRMIVASFFVKDLLLHWREGARWFWDTLVDADLAQNTLGWQWTAGCGADAAPYFRIFNPVSQGEKFDPYGHYVRKWCPELANLAGEWLHKPWQAPRETLVRAGVELGRDYPEPIVSHSIARQVALEAFDKMKSFAS